MKIKTMFVSLLTLLTLLLSTSISLAYTDYNPLGSANGYARGVKANFYENSTFVPKLFLFTGIEVLPLSQHKPAESEVDSFVKNALRYGCFAEFDKEITSANGFNNAYIWLNNPEGKITEDFIRKNLLNAMLVEKGYARVVDYGPNQKYVQYLLKIQSEAKENHRGIWE